jgi:hypothetical protein
MARFGAGQMYVNYTGEGDEDKVRASYPAETYARLAAVKAHYDPANRFRFNQNIRPALSASPGLRRLAQSPTVRSGCVAFR